MNKLSIASFTNLGFLYHSRGFEPLEADLTGQRIVVTGATGGLGLESARSLASFGADVVIIGRSADKLARAAGELGGRTETIEADLSLMTEVRRAASTILSGGTVDVLINNVGVLLPERTTTREGLETTLATNLAGHFLLTNLLIPRLVESAPSRIINVTSGGMYSTSIKPDDLQTEHNYTGTAAYARTKRGQVILTEMWADQLRGANVVVHAMHPGWAKTAGVANSLPTFDKVMRPLLRTPEQGADTIVWLAAASEPARSSGRLWFDRRPAPTHLDDSTRESEADREKLWRQLGELTGIEPNNPGSSDQATTQESTSAQTR